MRKNVILLTAMFCLSLFNQSFASEPQKIVGVYPFQGANEEIKTALQAKISSELLKLNRVVVVDRKNEVAQLEMQKQRTEAFMNSEDIGEFGRQSGAGYVLLGTVTQGDVEKIEKLTKKGTEVSWQVVIGLDLSVIDVATGKVLMSESFSSMKKSDSRSKILNDCYTDIVRKSSVFLQNSFPINGEVVSATVDKKGYVNGIVLNIGKENGVQVKQRYDLIEKQMIDSKMFDIVGVIEIIEVSGENMAKARIVSGNKERLKAIYEKPTSFAVKTRAIKNK